MRPKISLPEKIYDKTKDDIPQSLIIAEATESNFQPIVPEKLFGDCEVRFKKFHLIFIYFFI